MPETESLFSIYKRLFFDSLQGVQSDYVPYMIAAAIIALIFSVVLARIDIREKRLPNLYVLPLIAISFALIPLWEIPLEHLFGAIISAVVFLSLPYIKIRGKQGFGMGDSKLLVAIGATLGPGLLFAFLFAGLFFFAALVLQARTPRPEGMLNTQFPLGPALLVGFWAMVAVNLFIA